MRHLYNRSMQNEVLCTEGVVPAYMEKIRYVLSYPLRMWASRRFARSGVAFMTRVDARRMLRRGYSPPRRLVEAIEMFLSDEETKRHHDRLAMTRTWVGDNDPSTSPGPANQQIHRRLEITHKPIRRI